MGRRQGKDGQSNFVVKENEIQKWTMTYPHFPSKYMAAGKEFEPWGRDARAEIPGS